MKKTLVILMALAMILGAFADIAMPAIQVDHAKIHFGVMFYLGITSGDTALGNFAPVTAVYGKQTWETGFYRIDSVAAAFLTQHSM